MMNLSTNPKAEQLLLLHPDTSCFSLALPTIAAGIADSGKFRNLRKAGVSENFFLRKEEIYQGKF